MNHIGGGLAAASILDFFFESRIHLEEKRDPEKKICDFNAG